MVRGRNGSGKMIGQTGYNSGLGGTADKAIASVMTDPQAIGIQKLACCVIFEAARSYPSEGTMIFFKSDDFDFWAALAGLSVSGNDILNALIANNGVDKRNAMLFKESIKDE